MNYIGLMGVSYKRSVVHCFRVAVARIACPKWDEAVKKQELYEVIMVNTVILGVN